MIFNREEVYKMFPLVSIVLPTFNVEDYLKRCIFSILNQTYNNFEVIFVNDGSTDNTEELFHQFSLDSRLQFVTKKNEGSGIARNYGLARAKGKYIYFMDPDDELKNDLFSDCIPLLEKENSEMLVFGFEKVDSYTGKVEFFNTDKTAVFEDEETVRDQIINLSKIKGINSVWNKIYRKDFLINNNLFFTNLSTGQDAEFNWKVYDALSNFIEKKGIYYRYYTNRAGSAQTKFNPETFYNEVTLLRQMESVTKKWGRQKEYSQLVKNYHLNILFKEAKNLRKVPGVSLMNLKNHHLYKEAKKIPFSQIYGWKQWLKLLIIKLNLINLVS